jgi:hypothetical protein
MAFSRSDRQAGVNCTSVEGRSSQIDHEHIQAALVRSRATWCREAGEHCAAVEPTQRTWATKLPHHLKSRRAANRTHPAPAYERTQPPHRSPPPTQTPRRNRPNSTAPLRRRPTSGLLRLHIAATSDPIGPPEEANRSAAAPAQPQRPDPLTGRLLRLHITAAPDRRSLLKPMATRRSQQVSRSARSAAAPRPAYELLLCLRSAAAPAQPRRRVTRQTQPLLCVPGPAYGRLFGLYIAPTSHSDPTWPREEANRSAAAPAQPQRADRLRPHSRSSASPSQLTAAPAQTPWRATAPLRPWPRLRTPLRPPHCSRLPLRSNRATRRSQQVSRSARSAAARRQPTASLPLLRRSCSSPAASSEPNPRCPTRQGRPPRSPHQSSLLLKAQRATRRTGRSRDAIQRVPLLASTTSSQPRSCSYSPPLKELRCGPKPARPLSPRRSIQRGESGTQATGVPPPLERVHFSPPGAPTYANKRTPSFPPSRFGRAEGHGISYSRLRSSPSALDRGFCALRHLGASSMYRARGLSTWFPHKPHHVGFPLKPTPWRSTWNISVLLAPLFKAPETASEASAPLPTAASPQREPGRFSAFLPCPDLGSTRREENQMPRPIQAMQCQAFHVERSETAPITSTGVPRGTFRAPTTRGLAHQLRFRTAFRPPTEGEQCLRELSGAGLPGRTGLSKAAFAMQKRLPNRCQ